MQTAVEWFWSKIALRLSIEQVNEFLSELQQAKEMDKEQQIDFAKHCLNKAKDLDILTSFMNAEQYYNETYLNK